MITEHTSRKQSGGLSVVEKAITALESKGIEWCALSGYDLYPTCIATDLDILINPKDYREAQCLMRNLPNVSLLQEKWYDSKGRSYISTEKSHTGSDTVAIDLMASHTYRGLQIMEAREFLRDRQLAQSGIWVTSPQKEFIYYLTKRISKSALMAIEDAIGPEQGSKLCSLYSTAPRQSRQELKNFFPTNLSTTVVTACENDDWTDVRSRLPEFLRSLRWHVWRAAPLTTTRSYFANLPRLISRLYHPNGLMIAILGPDGAGKSTLISRLPENLHQLFDQTAAYHLRPRANGATGKTKGEVVDPYAKPVRGLGLSILQAVYWWIDHTAGYWGVVFPRLVRQTCILFDRYHVDLQCDPARYQYGGPIWLAKFMSFLLPSPDLYIVLDIDPNVAVERQSEMSFSDSERQRKTYLAFAKNRRNCVVLDATRSTDQLVTSVFTTIGEFLSRRNKNRIGS